MRIDAGEVVSLLGRNGVGRSTPFKAIMGEVLPQGSIKFKGTDIAGLPSYKIAHLGLGYVPEHRDIFSRPDGEAELDAWHQGYHPRSLARVAVNARYCPGMADVQAAASNRNLRWLHVPDLNLSLARFLCL